MKKLMIALFLFLLILAGCTKAQPKNEEIEFLEVNLTINPEHAKVNETIQFTADVSFGKEKVEDADEVKFEIWRSKSEEHEEVVVQHSKDGKYELDKQFSEEGTYYVYAHVTARGMHNMPKKEFIVGTASEPETDSNSNMNHSESKKEENSSHHH
ncbi:FixH family protein [Peribacillus acanthi]|uniref:FixH family protein n=1 Tax=Peribacillus acanthi TaxID=2171554 RepID=UPI000D3EDFC5|nr:FixH family protein [Peribacillus acanthi]